MQMLKIASRLLLQSAGRLRKGGVIINEHTLTQAELRLHVQVLARCFDFIRLEDLPLCLSQPVKRPFCLMTFRKLSSLTWLIRHWSFDQLTIFGKRQPRLKQCSLPNSK